MAKEKIITYSEFQGSLDTKRLFFVKSNLETLLFVLKIQKACNINLSYIGNYVPPHKLLSTHFNIFGGKKDDETNCKVAVIVNKTLKYNSNYFDNNIQKEQDLFAASGLIQNNTYCYLIGNRGNTIYKLNKQLNLPNNHHFFDYIIVLSFYKNFSPMEFQKEINSIFLTTAPYCFEANFSTLFCSNGPGSSKANTLILHQLFDATDIYLDRFIENKKNKLICNSKIPIINMTKRKKFDMLPVNISSNYYLLLSKDETIE